MSESETTRVEAFSDGVFAIAITLLVLEFRVPHPSEASDTGLLRGLLQLWPSLLAFVLSFGVILVMWMNHHGLFRLIRSVDSRFLFANGFLLLLITFVPFPTALLAQYLGRPGERVAAAVYCGTFLPINIAYNLLLHTAADRRRLLRPNVPDALIAKIRRAYRWAFPIYLGATLLALWNAGLGLALCSSLWILWAVLDYRGDATGGATA